MIGKKYGQKSSRFSVEHDLIANIKYCLMLIYLCRFYHPPMLDLLFIFSMDI